MQSNEIAFQYLVSPTQLSSYPSFSTMNNNQISNNLIYSIQEQQSIRSNNSTSDEGDESIMNERKQRRMISNRESARRSRMRKQRQLDELWSHVISLRNENRRLVDKFKHVTELHDNVLQENVQLKEEAFELRKMVNDIQLSSPYSALRDLEELANAIYLRDEEINLSNLSS